MARIQAKWECIVQPGSTESEVIQRSSHIIGVVDNTAYIYSGELKPREAVDADVISVRIQNAPSIQTPQALSSSGPRPERRVGSASISLPTSTLILSPGRPGIKDPSAAEETGLYTYTPSTSTWTYLSPSGSEHPEARSFHCLACDEEGATVYLHAGYMPGQRFRDLWAWEMEAGRWRRLADAPGAPRGGASIAWVKSTGKLYRMHGFDGKGEVGGEVDMYDPRRDEWRTVEFKADGVEGPSPRSVCALVPVVVGGRERLVTLFGELGPSEKGHAGAGRMAGDVWVFDVQEERWEEVEIEGEKPERRGWFAADVLREGGENRAVVVHGGLSESNERFGDAWVLKFS